MITTKMSTSSCLTADVIRFYCPDSERTNLYVTGISVAISDSEHYVHEKLDRVFSAFGPIYEIQVFVGRLQAATDPTASGKSYYAFIKFYSPGDASRAKAALNKKYMINGNLLKVSFSTRKVQDNYPLSYSRCCHLANHYLGYNGWSSRIDQVYEDKDHGDPSMVRFLCATKLEIPRHGVTCDGIGLADETFTVGDFLSRLEAYKSVRKISFRRAMENAFQQIALVVLSNGKVSVELCPEKPDEMVFMDDQIRKQLVEVNNVDDEVPAEVEDTTNLEDGSQLDAANEELLLDLLVDA